MRKTKVEFWKDGRYCIIDEETSEILDDAQGFGYKDKQKATKAMWYKFGGGKEKKDGAKKSFREWLKVEGNKSVLKALENCLEMNYKEISRGETSMSEIIALIEIEKGVKIPKFVIDNI